VFRQGEEGLGLGEGCRRGAFRRGFVDCGLGGSEVRVEVGWAGDDESF
jgi:hypothetical protein